MTGGRPGAGEAHRAIERCAALTEAMLLAAEAGDWSDVGGLDQERRECIDLVGRAALDPADLDLVVERMQKLVSMDAQLRASAAESRRQALAAVRLARGQRRASAAYDALARQI